MEEDIIDWQHPEVTAGTVTRLMEATQDWRKTAKHESDARDQASLLAALRFAGEKADGFQMARYLEESRLWAADQSLVALLRHARDHRDAAIADLERKRNPIPLILDYDGDGYPIDLQFQDVDGTIFRILHKRRDFDMWVYKIMNIKTNYTAINVGHGTIKDRINRFGVK